MKDIRKKIGVAIYPAWRVFNSIKSIFLNYPKSGNNYNSISSKTMIEYNKHRLYGSKKLFCYNPFVSLFFDTVGNGIACCRSHKIVLGSYPQQSIKEIWFGKKAEKLRNHMLYNDLSMGCDYCKIQIDSKRFSSLPSMHAEQFATTKIIKFPRIIEFELSNKCNLKCVMCSGIVSSSIRHDREKLEPLPFLYDDGFVEQLKEFIPHLKKAYFYGGEPFLIDIYYKIWDEIIKINPKITLSAVTNGMIMNERVKHIIQNTDFHLIVSLDSLDKERAESIRVGSNLDVVLENIFKFTEYSGNRVSISHTPMTINWFETPDIIKFCNENNFRINLSYVEGPANFALWSLMPKELDEIFSFYNNIEWKNSNKNFTSKYNIQVFNEWKEQVRFFRDKNKDILGSFNNIDNDWEIEKNKIIDFFTELKMNMNEYTHKLIDLERDLFAIINQIPLTLWNLESLKLVSSELSNKDIALSSEFQKYLNNPKLLKQFFAESKQADFFQRYY